MLLVALLDGLPNHHLHRRSFSIPPEEEEEGRRGNGRAIGSRDMSLFQFSILSLSLCTERSVYASYSRWDEIRFTEPFHSGVIVSETRGTSHSSSREKCVSPASLPSYRFLDREEAVNLMHPTNPTVYLRRAASIPRFRGRTNRAEFCIYSGRRLEKIRRGNFPGNHWIEDRSVSSGEPNRSIKVIDACRF